MASQSHSAPATELIATLAKMSLLSIVPVIENMDQGEVAHALAEMSSDPEYVIHNANESAEPNWNVFEAGGPLAADRVEVRVGPAVTGISDKDGFLALLRRFESVEGEPVSGTKWPWLYWWRPAGLPECLMTLFPFGNRGFMSAVHIGQTHLNNGFINQKPEVVQQILKADAARRLSVWFSENEKRPMSDHPRAIQF